MLNYLIINAGVAQLVERQPSKLNVAGSNPVSRSKLIYELVAVIFYRKSTIGIRKWKAGVAQG